jgi:hypothetical protein
VGGPLQVVESTHDPTDTQLGIVQEVLDEHALVSGLVPISDETWAIYGSIPVDGEVIVAEFDNRAEAESTLEPIAAAEQETVTPKCRPLKEGSPS